MNKNIAIVITAVILLGMGLVTYNEYNTPTSAPVAHQAQSSEPIAVQAEEKQQEATQTMSASATPADKEPTPPLQATLAAKTAPTASVPAVPAVPTAASVPTIAQAPQTAPKAAPQAPPAPPKAAPAPAQVTPPAPAVTTPPAVKPVPAQNIAQKVEDPVQKALEASRKESTLPPTVLEAQKEAQKAAVKAAPLPKVIKRITVMKVGDGTTVRLDSNQTPTYKIMRLTSPERLVLDLDGTWKLRAPGVPSNAVVSNVRIGDHKEGTRIVIDLKKVPADIRYLKYGETGLDVRLR